MRLKSLDIKGFKSFADRTVINFGEDVIGVVGSNGCGKSNIVDAIRWVLGEQKTKQLRSDSMTSVIFNGTKGRKSAGLAEVSLSFINDRGVLPLEYQEVTIKRMLYKDGSSTYELNGVKCRLKDISNLLADTGMGSDSYAIIALGMVDDLLQDKDNSRLKLFEQAAGISKYKSRKKETFSKLRATEADLSRVEDLLFEIEKNLKSLERQAKRAKKFLTLKEEYKRLSLELSYFRIANYKKSYKSLEEQIKKEQEKKTALDQTIEQLEKRVGRDQASSVEKEQALQRQQKALGKLIGRIKGRENDQKILAQKIQFLSQNKEKIDERLAENKRRFAAIEDQIDVQSERLDTQHALGGTLNSELQEAKTKLESIREQHRSVKQALEVYVEEQQHFSKASFEQEKQLAILQNQENAAYKAAERLQQSLQQRQQEMQQVLNQAEQLAQLQKEQEATVQQLKKEEANRQEQLATVEEQLEKGKEELAQQNRSLDAKRNEYQLLQSLVENMEGFSASVKFLSKQRQWADKIVLLSDVFYCEPEYRAAVENYLEPYLNYYVVADFAEALRAIDLLEEHKKGKANFFLLNQLETQTTIAPPALPNSFLALNVLKYDAVYQSLAQHLLGKVFIGEAPVDLKTLSPEHIYLTQDGKWIQQRNTVRGGSVGAFEGKKIGRKKNVALLKEQLETLKASTQIIRDQVKALQLQQQNLRQANQQPQLRKAEQQLQQTLRQAIGLQGKVDSFEQYQNDSQGQITNYKEQAQRHKEKQIDVQRKVDKIQEALLKLRDNVSEKDEAAQEMAAAMAEASADYNKKHIEQVRHQNAMTTIEKELDFAYRQHKEIKTQRERDEALLNESGDSLGQTKTDLEQIVADLETWKKERQEQQGTVAEAEKTYFTWKGDSSAREKDWREKQRLQTQTLEFLHQLEQKFNEVKLQLTAIAERLSVEFEVRINDLINEQPNPDYEEAVLASNVDQLRTRIQNYGAINPMAIEAYDEIQERHKLILEQRNDLVQSKDNLMATISEIEEKATELFMTAFNKARGYFVQVFRSLFDEDDTCDLKLVNPETPLESKIDIIAKPKGKRPLSINQLSGGEKTLTATALLFSLYLLKPAPFCIFDEVDAPLDDANIAKFNNIIKDFSKNSQFIIVTHNKKTMQAVDIMYGVTMVKGISRVVPVDFRALETVQ
ncbi:MAG: chromosome segregation protein SMC [Aureispira sp.]